MGYKLKFLPRASLNILEIEAHLFDYSPAAADTFTEEIERLTETLTKHPLMYQEYEDDSYYRSMPLSYDYRLFYHVNEAHKTIEIHRVIHGMMNLKRQLMEQ